MASLTLNVVRRPARHPLPRPSGRAVARTRVRRRSGGSGGKQVVRGPAPGRVVARGAVGVVRPRGRGGGGVVGVTLELWGRQRGVRRGRELRVVVGAVGRGGGGRGRRGRGRGAASEVAAAGTENEQRECKINLRDWVAERVKRLQTFHTHISWCCDMSSIEMS